ncbi:hypothetical protein LTS10_001851 [Elasticomyces elasticus]|nr:hypothetical protein LTS10_001851 [Elasticomyces elasticus]
MSKQVPFEERLQACINDMLRAEYPYTHTSDINAVATDAARRAAFGIVQRKNARKEGVRPLKFLELPAEIRNVIYEHTVKVQSKIFGDSITVGNMSMTCDCARQPPITRVSRQVREETLAMFYSINHFVIQADCIFVMMDPASLWRIAKAWLGAIGQEHAESIKDITIEYFRTVLVKRGTSIEREMAETSLRFVAKVAMLHEK